SHAWRTAHRFFDLPLTPELRTLAGRTESAVAEAAERFGFASWTTRWQDVVEDPEIDVIDICTPGDTHYEIALAALAAGKHVLCEKPLANSVEHSAEMAAAAAAAKEASPRRALSLCGFSYRRTPALAYARQLIAEGAVGEIRQVRAHYLQDWLSDADAPMTWRLDKELAGSGALGDIGAHIIDLTQWLTGEDTAAVSGTLQTVVPTRPSAGTSQGLGGKGDADGERQQVTVDDVALFTARFASGVLGSFEATRMAQGRKNAMRVEINGSAGSLAFDFERMNELEFYDATAPTAARASPASSPPSPSTPMPPTGGPPGTGSGTSTPSPIRSRTSSPRSARAPTPPPPSRRRCRSSACSPPSRRARRTAAAGPRPPGRRPPTRRPPPGRAPAPRPPRSPPDDHHPQRPRRPRRLGRPPADRGDRPVHPLPRGERLHRADRGVPRRLRRRRVHGERGPHPPVQHHEHDRAAPEIGRASCRERKDLRKVTVTVDEGAAVGSMRLSGAGT